MRYASVFRQYVGASRSVRENRKRQRRRVRCFRAGWWYSGVALVAVALGGNSKVVWSAVKQYVTQHPYFAVEDIQVSSDGRFALEQVRIWSGVEIGMSLWAVHPPQVEARLRAQPWVRTATVRREFPRRVLIAVQTRRPIAIILRQPPTYLDDMGGYFVPQEGIQEVDLPYVSGLAQMALDTPEVRDILRDVVYVLALARLWREPLSEIHWDAYRGYTLFLAERRVTIDLGEQPTPEQFARVRTVLETWPADWPAALFDARFAHQVVVRPAMRSLGQTHTPDPPRHPL